MTHGIYDADNYNGTPNILNKNVDKYGKAREIQKVIKNPLSIPPKDGQEKDYNNILEKICEN
jgi:hypothetical protein